MSRRKGYSDYWKKSKNALAIDNHEKMIDCRTVFDDTFGGWFVNTRKKKTKSQILYEKELNRYNKAISKTITEYSVIEDILPSECVDIIKSFEDEPEYIHRDDYITRCQYTYLKFRDCGCDDCVEAYIDEITNKAMDYYEDMYDDWE
jgi:hypothetical protein